MKLDLLQKLRSVETGGRGLQAIADIGVDECVLHVQRSKIITRSDLLTQHGHRLLNGWINLNYINSDIRRNLSELDSLGLFMFFEMVIVDDSQYADYLSTLPTSFEFMASFEPPSDLPQIMSDLIEIQISNIESSYQNSLSALNQEYRPAFTRDLHKYTWHCVNTRCVSIPNIDSFDSHSIALCPFFDMFNHSGHDGIQTLLHYDVSHKLFEIRSSVALKMNEQMFIKYGNHDNLTLFCEYGFIDRMNGCRHDVLNLDKLFTQHLIPRMSTEQLKECDSNELRHDLIVDRDGELSWNLSCVLQLIFCKSVEEMQLWKDMRLGKRDSVSDRILQASGRMCAWLCQNLKDTLNSDLIALMDSKWTAKQDLEFIINTQLEIIGHVIKSNPNNTAT